MPIASRSWAKVAMNGWSMPAPAPCASTRHAFAGVGRCISPDTRICSLTEIVTGFAMEDATAPVCAEFTGGDLPERVRHGFYTVRAYLRQQIYGRRIYRGHHEYRDTPCPPEEPGAARRRRYRPRPLAGRLFRRHTPLIGAHAIRTRLDAPCRDVRPESRAWQSCKRRTPRYGYLPRCTSGSETDSSSTS